MKTIKLGSTGLEVKEFGFGSMYLPRVSAEESDIILERALELGINYFDTASAYQDSEEKLGRVLSKHRDKCVILSRSIGYKMGGPDAFKKDFEQSMSRLKLDYIDFYGFHSVNQPDELELVMGEPLNFLKEQKEQGRVKHIAITSHNTVTLTKAIETGEFEMAMFPFNVIERECLDELMNAAQKMNVATSVMKPLGGGVIDSKSLALRFFFNYDSGVVTPGMCSIKQLEENYNVFSDRQPLSDEELAYLESEVEELGKDFCRRCSYCMPCPNGILMPFVHMVHMKCYDKPMDDEIIYTLKMGKRLQPALEKCDACGQCVDKCPYDIPTPERIPELLELLNKV